MTVNQISANNLISRISSSTTLDQAFAWLAHKRVDAHFNNPFWQVSSRWSSIRARLRRQLQAGEYHFSPLSQMRLNHDHWVSSWDPVDAIVLKAVSMVLTPLLQQECNLSSATHLKGQGGLKFAVRAALRFSQRNTFIFKTDIAQYYQSIDHHRLFQQCCEIVKDKRVLSLLWQVMNRVHVCGGVHRLIENQSIPRGCSLSPLFAALYLLPIDKLARQHQCDYVRYMDDFVFFCNTRGQLRQLIKQVYSVLDELKLTLAASKTYIGRVAKGFNFLGYHISPQQLTVSVSSWQRFKVKWQLLYEQDAPIARLLQYLKNWSCWATTGVPVNKQALLTTISSFLPPQLIQAATQSFVTR